MESHECTFLGQLFFKLGSMFLPFSFTPAYFIQLKSILVTSWSWKSERWSCKERCTTKSPLSI